MMADLGRERGASRIDLAETEDFELGGLHVSPAHRQVHRNGERRELEPRVAQVLVALADARPGVISRERLIERCWEGRIVGDDAINRCIVALRHLAKEFSPEPFAIETVARVGYCLIESPGSEQKPAPAAAVGAGSRKLAIAALLALILVSAMLAVGWSRYGRADADPASIAVLPFRNLSNGDSYFAEGIGEEIMGQLARESQFRVAGSFSSAQFGKNPDVREVARRLDVDYVLEGSVRTQGDRVRVNAALLRTSDNVRLWSESYDGTLDDVFAIQRQIGGAIAGALRRQLIQAFELSGPLVTNGEAYNLYLTARGLLRTRQREVGRTAANLLREAIELDPGYAPAWASLATATQLDGALRGHEGLIAALPEAQGHARRALHMAPNLSEAHRTLGTLVGYGTPEAQALFRHAATHDRNSAENMLWLGVAHGAAGDFEAELTSYRRAAELDPLWFRTIGHAAVAIAEMGDRTRAEAIVKRGSATNQATLDMLLAHVAWTFGDISEAARHWLRVAESDSPRWSGIARRNLIEARFAAGLATSPPVAVPPPPDKPRSVRVWMAAPPSPSVWRERNRSRIAAEVYRGDNHVAAKLMLGAGRERELAETYAGKTGLLGLRSGSPLRFDQLAEVPVVALALRRSGREAEAARLLREADSAVRAVYRRGQVPFWLDADAAALWAAQGRQREALAMLEQAMARGWIHFGSTDLRDIADEPAFESLRGQSRFNRIRAKLVAHIIRERGETARVLKIPV